MPAAYDVFLSHAWADGECPQQIADALTKAFARFVEEAGDQSTDGQFCSDCGPPRDYKSDSPAEGSEQPQSELSEGKGEI